MAVSPDQLSLPLFEVDVEEPHARQVGPESVRSHDEIADVELGYSALAPDDVAAHCGLSRKAVYRAIERGELRAFRLCSRLRIRPEDLNAWLDAHVVGQPARVNRPPRLPSESGLRRLLPPR